MLSVLLALFLEPSPGDNCHVSIHDWIELSHDGEHIATVNVDVIGETCRSTAVIYRLHHRDGSLLYTDAVLSYDIFRTGPERPAPVTEESILEWLEQISQTDWQIKWGSELPAYQASTDFDQQYPYLHHIEPVTYQMARHENAPVFCYQNYAEGSQCLTWIEGHIRRSHHEGG